MNYTIAQLEMIHQGSKLTLNKSGAWYYVGFTYLKNDEKVFVHSRDNLGYEDALSLYQRISELMLRSLYSDEDKAQWVQKY